MRSCMFTLLAAALVAVVCGCPKTAVAPVAVSGKLLGKYKTEGETPKVTILMFTLDRADANVPRIKRALEGIENLSDGEVKFMEVVNDREGKDAYGVRGFPTILFFDEAGELKTREGSGLDMETARRIVTELGATVRKAGEEEEVEEAPPPDLGAEGGN